MIFDSLVEFTDYLAEMDRQMQFMLRFLKSDYGHDLLYESVKEALETATYEIESDGPISEQETIDIDIRSAIPHAVSLTNTARTPDILDTVVEGDAEIVVEYTYDDEEQSFFDEESHSYIYLISITASSTHKIHFKIPMSFSANKCLGEDEELEEESDEVFDEKEMELDAYTEQTFYLTSDNRTNYDIIERSDNDTYDTCPDCGCRIGIDNDGGNGFCIRCAPNH